MIMVKTLRYFLVAALAMMSFSAMADTDVTFTLNDPDAIKALGITLPDAGQGTEVTSVTKDGVTITCTNGGTPTRIYQGSGTKAGNYDLRVYKNGGSLTFTAGTNNIKKIVVTGTSTMDLLSGDGYTASSEKTTGTWEGDAQSVTLTATATATIYTITVTYGASTDTRTATSIEFSGHYLTKFTSGKDGVSTNLPTATVKAGDAAVAGAAITWTITKGTGWNEEVAIPTISGNTITGIGNSAYGDLIVKASYEGGTSYKPSSKTYTLKMYKGRMNIKEILEDFDKLGDKNWNNGVQTSYWQVDEISENNVVPKEALVTYAKNSYTYIKDNDGSLLLYGSNLGYKQGDIITGDLGNGQIGAIYGSLKTYSGLLELVTKKDECEFKVKSSDNPVEPTTITAAQLDKSKMNEYLKIENAVYTTAFNNNNATFKVGEKEFTVRNAFGLSDDELGLTVGETYTLVGMGAMYNTPQLYLISATSTSGINELKAANTNFEGKTYNVAGQAVNKGYKGLVIMNGKKFVNK